MVKLSHLPYKIFPQVVAAFITAGGALSCGLSLGWSALSEAEVLFDNPKFNVSFEEFSWVGSCMTLTAALICVPIGIICNYIGRKSTMILTTLVGILGWLLLIFAENLAMLYAGRAVCGLACGSTCVVAPTYIAEISAKEIRGALGTFFQLFITLGILIAYVLGYKLSLFNGDIACCVISGVFLLFLFFIPESPDYFVYKGKSERALESYAWLRGKKYDASAELAEVQAEINALKANPVPWHKAMTRKSSYKGLLISMGLMLFQQISGINVFVFYTGEIFGAADSDLDPGLQTVIIGLVMFFCTFLSIAIIDLVGRTTMLLASAFLMVKCSVLLGLYFFYHDRDGPGSVRNFTWLPIVCLCIFVIAFSIGFGPIPWIMAGELFGTDVRGPCAAITGFTNWIIAFIVTKTFANFIFSIGRYGTFWLYACCTALGFFFVALIVPETKNKSLGEIQDELNRTKLFKDFKAQFTRRQNQ